MSIMPQLELHALEKVYREGGRERRVLHGVSGSIRRGEFVALLGASGSGKSTLLNLIGGIDAPSAGRIRIAGTEITGLKERERTLFRRRHLGFVFQFFNLVSTLTVLENLLLPLELNGVGRRESRQRAETLLERVGLAGRGDSYPERLSGGEQQRVAIARAVVHGPDLLLADEPTGSLDEASGRRAMSLIQELVSDRGLTLLLVTHSVELAARAGRVLQLRDGRLLEAAEG